ncbi:HEAT repeat domain-containing protein [Nocardia alni]|uniref:HEAT repeat domain-containing protein n=1 Tax=Nocardia alni TaxID=2815723 RepID=UPI001C233AD7|nr:HEAT repeat domain-containing protein [Nocardia alni]
MSNDIDLSKQIVSDYRQAGGYGEKIYDLPHDNNRTKESIAVLAEWLIELEERWPGEETEARATARILLIEALDCRQARKSAAIPALLSQFELDKTMSLDTRWSAGNSLYKIPADDAYFDNMVRVAQNRTLGPARQMVVNWLWKSQRKDEASAVALSQLDDESVQGHALEALARLRTQGIRDQVEPFLSSKNRWHRRCARSILDHLTD